MTELLNKTLSQIVTENYQAAHVFEKYGLDFCCKGKRALSVACNENGLVPENILTELETVLRSSTTAFDYGKMSLTELAEYIIRVHHDYVKIHLPQTIQYVERVATKHGDRFPYMVEVLKLFRELETELMHHMKKEEKILFPRVKLLELNAVTEITEGYLSAPIEVMEHEHDAAGTIMHQIRVLTNDYRAPEDACTTFRLALASLQAFEADLHHHVHLENNILFPKAIALWKNRMN
jgi:regulator of cell morphogenesis and NO signaling